MPRTTTRTLPFSAPRGFVARLTRSATDAIARRRNRRALGRLDPHLLRDIGLSSDEARTEAAKPFWQP